MSMLLDAAYCATLLPHYLYHRHVTGKYGCDAPEKLGVLPERIASQKKCLWIHAVSVGETLAARTLVQAFLERYPEWDIRISTTTATGRDVAQKEFGAERVLYYPLDCSWMVRRAFERVKPTLVVLMELEVWPHFLEEATRRFVPVAVANVRITDRSVARFKRVGRLAQPMLDRVSLWLSQSEKYAERLLEIGVAQDLIHTVGSLKYDTVKTERDEAARTRYRALLGVDDDAPVWVAGSTHAGEDEIVLEAFRAVRTDVPGLKLVLVPRHPERVPAIETLCQPYGEVVRRSAISDGESACAPIVLVDVMGELAALYAAADVAFMGGTFLEAVGGHNMLEPCGIACPTVVGPHVENFMEAMAVLRAADGVVCVNAPDALAGAVGTLLADSVTAVAMARRGQDAVVAQQGATGRSLEWLTSLVANELVVNVE